MKKNIILAIIACFILLIAVLIYLCFRSPNILFFKWLDLFGINYSIFQNVKIKLPNIILYNFTNMLFLIFGYIFVYIIWNKNKICFNFYIALITLLNIIYEIITHDISDIITIMITFGFCILIYNKHFGVKYAK
jgi:hypothetical protein